MAFPYEKVEDRLESIQLALRRRNRTVSSAVTGAMIALYAMWRNGILRPENAEKRLFLCGNGFGVAGAVLLGVGLLSWVVYLGAFDIIGYGIRLVTSALEVDRTRRRAEKNGEKAAPPPNNYNYRSYSLADYRREKALRRRFPKGLFIISLAYFALSVLLCNL